MGKKRILDYAQLKEAYEKLKEEKSDILELKEQNMHLKQTIKKLEGDNRELYLLIHELMKKKGNKWNG